MRVNRTVNVNYEVLPGKIEDTSFIPSGAHDECTNGYQWLVVSTGNTGKHIHLSIQCKLYLQELALKVLEAILA